MFVGFIVYLEPRRLCTVDGAKGTFLLRAPDPAMESEWHGLLKESGFYDTNVSTTLRRPFILLAIVNGSFFANFK